MTTKLAPIPTIAALAAIAIGGAIAIDGACSSPSTTTTTTSPAAVCAGQDSTDAAFVAGATKSGISAADPADTCGWQASLIRLGHRACTYAGAARSRQEIGDSVFPGKDFTLAEKLGVVDAAIANYCTEYSSLPEYYQHYLPNSYEVPLDPNPTPSPNPAPGLQMVPR
jgi:Protein of unknown function (DUF732)